jgi:hypothetical protein|tara:strand:- start:588 stop:908 length:321 start_codon:yes stop_codon:yes gene_type:complete
LETALLNCNLRQQAHYPEYIGIFFRIITKLNFYTFSKTAIEFFQYVYTSITFLFTKIDMKLKVTIDEKSVELNSYVEMVFLKVIIALISTLRGPENWKKVQLEIES